tara:strand:+ start:8029 stop:8664 length:636 start_codon:yes stop_codon:yes gene_type:complete
MSQVVISVTLLGNVEGGVDDESGFYFELEKALGQVAQEFGLNAHIDDVHDNADGGLMQPDNFEKAWTVAKNERFGEKFNEKLRRMKEGARGVPEKFSDLKPTTGEDHNRKVMANILETDNDGIEDEYERLKDMFDNEPPSHSAPNALGSKGLIDRARKAGPVKKSDEAFYVDDVRELVMQGYEVMDAVRQVSRILGLNGSKLMRAYVEAYR